MPPIEEVSIDQLRPTQLTIGFIEVRKKKKHLAALAHDARRDFMRAHPIPAVRGPDGHLFITDHHHLGRAALEAGVGHGFVAVEADLSSLAGDAFWLEMDRRLWVHPLDQNGVRHRYGAIPHHLDKLVDDIYRSLAGYVRDAGGYPKTPTAFAEFVWADFFRRALAIEDVAADFETAVTRATALARSPAAQAMPGFGAPPRRLDPAGVHRVGQRAVVVRVGRVAQAAHHPGAVGRAAVLAHLPLALDPRDGNLDADDGLELGVDEVRRRVVHRPRQRTAALLGVGQVGELAAQPDGILHRPGPAPGVHRGVVPGGHDTAGLGLGGVPRRAHVARFALEHHQAFGHAGEFAPVGVGPRHVGAQHAVSALVGIDQEGHRRGHQPGRAVGDEERQRMGAHQRVQRGGIAFAERGGDVHGAARGQDERGQMLPRTAGRRHAGRGT